jgi:GNAT superfamily N-acetyltransferase
VDGILVRPARPDDAPFLALAMQEADRGHTGFGSWDVMFPGADVARLECLVALATTAAPSYVHWSTFLVAEADDRLVGTVASYVPSEEPPERFTSACQTALGADADAALARHGAWSRDYFTVQIPRDTLRVEWVYTDPAARGRGVSTLLIGRLLDDGRAHGHTTAHVGTYLENEPAIATYRRLGFEPFAEARHVDYEAVFGTPGLVFLRRTL